MEDWTNAIIFHPSQSPTKTTKKKNPTKIKKKETYNGGKIWKETMALQIWKLENR